jgi:hypothetical protein
MEKNIKMRARPLNCSAVRATYQTGGLDKAGLILLVEGSPCSPIGPNRPRPPRVSRLRVAINEVGLELRITMRFSL